jgi:histidinol-phosphate aminotransferase
MIEPRADIALMEGYHSPQLDVEIRLNTNESPFPPPEGWAVALGAAVSDIDWNRYPDRGAVALRSRIAELHGVEATQVFIGNGSNEVLQCLLLAFGGPGRRAAVFEPTYALHSHIARITATEVTVGERDDEFALRLDEIERVVGRGQPDITFLCSPNNPSGMIELPEMVEATLSLAPGLVVIDEAYGQFAPRSYLDDATVSESVIVTRTFSKTWSMAGARLGYCIGPAGLIDVLWKVALPYHLDALKQEAGLLALDYVDEMDSRVATLVEERDRLMARLGRLPIKVWPSAANFVLIRPDTVDGVDVWQQLVDAGVLVRNCASWPRLDGCLRVTIGTTADDDRFITELERILS